MIDKKDILILMPLYGWTARYVHELGYTVENPYICNGFLGRGFREICFKMNLRIENLMCNNKAICNKKYIIVYEQKNVKYYIDYISRRHKNTKIFLLYLNCVNRSNSPVGIDDSLCEKWTFDRKDALKYNMKLYKGGAYFPQCKVKKESPEYDVFYIGKDKGRLANLLRIKKLFNDNDIKTLFYITPERSSQKINDGYHKPFIPYDEVLKYLSKTKAILHLVDGAQDGITIRIQESLIHKIKLITDDKSMKNYDFYNKNNIFILGEDNIDQLKQFLNTPYVDVKSKFFNHMFYDDMVNYILDMDHAK